MGAANLLPLVFYLSLLSNSVMDLSGRGQGTRHGGEGGKKKYRFGDWVEDDKNEEIGENYPSFLLSLKPSRLKNASQSSEYNNDASYEDLPDDVDSFTDTPSIAISGNESVKLRSNHSLAKSVSLGNILKGFLFIY